MSSEAIIEAIEKHHEVIVRGTAQKSPIAGARAPYWEWVAGEKQGEEWSVINGRAGSEGEIEVEAGGARGKFQIALLRLHLHPVFEKRIERVEALPAAVAAYGVKKAPIIVAEFCLRSGESYFAKIERVDAVKKVLLYLSDRPFEQGQTATPMTPRTLGWGL